MNDKNNTSHFDQVRAKVASAMPDSRKFYIRLSILDWVTAIVCLAFGVWQVAAAWPAPEWWAWLSLAIGVIGIPIAVLNPGKHFNKWVMRRLVRKR